MFKTSLILLLLVAWVNAATQCYYYNKDMVSNECKDANKFPLSADEKKTDTLGFTPDTCCYVAIEYRVESDFYCYPMQQDKAEEYFDFLIEKFGITVTEESYNEYIKIRCGDNEAIKRRIKEELSSSYNKIILLSLISLLVLII